MCLYVCFLHMSGSPSGLIIAEIGTLCRILGHTTLHIHAIQIEQQKSILNICADHKCLSEKMVLRLLGELTTELLFCMCIDHTCADCLSEIWVLWCHLFAGVALIDDLAEWSGGSLHTCADCPSEGIDPPLDMSRVIRHHVYFVKISLTSKPVGAERVGGSLYNCADCPCSSESILCLTCSEWLDAMCLLRFPLHVNPWEQREQRNGFSPVCWSMWEVTWPGERNIFPHCGHG